MTRGSQSDQIGLRQNSLYAYWLKTVLPERIEAGAARGTVGKINDALVHLCNFAGRDISIGEVDESVIEGFRAWLLCEVGFTDTTAAFCRKWVINVVRHARPDAFSCHQSDVEPIITPEQLRELRRSRGWSQEYLAMRLGVRSASVSFWENGKREITVSRAKQLRRILSAALADVGRFDARFVDREKITDALNVPGSLWEFFWTRFKPVKMTGWTPEAIRQVEIVIRRLAKQHDRSILLSELSDELLSAHMGWMLDSGSSRRLVNNARNNIVMLWKYAHKKGLVHELPDVPKLALERRLPIALSQEEFGTLLWAASEEQGVVAGIPAGLYWPALLLVCYDTGARARAIFALKREDIDTETGWLRVHSEYQKERNEQRFRLDEQTVRAVLKVWFPERVRLFPWIGPQQKRWEHFGRIAERAGLPNDRWHKFHCIRRTTATHIAAVAGIDAASRHIGHGSEYMTRKYIDPRFLAEKDTVRHLPRPVVKGGAE